MEQIIMACIYIGLLCGIFLIACVIGIMVEKIPFLSRLVERIIDSIKFN